METSELDQFKIQAIRAKQSLQNFELSQDHFRQFDQDSAFESEMFDVLCEATDYCETEIEGLAEAHVEHFGSNLRLINARNFYDRLSEWLCGRPERISDRELTHSAFSDAAVVLKKRQEDARSKREQFASAGLKLSKSLATQLLRSTEQNQESVLILGQRYWFLGCNADWDKNSDF